VHADSSRSTDSEPRGHADFGWIVVITSFAMIGLISICEKRAIFASLISASNPT